MATLLQDLRYACRGLFRTPGFTTVALLTVAIGTGANAAVFGFIDALLLRPAAGVHDPGHLVTVFTSDFSSSAYEATSYPDFQSMREDTATFASLAAYDSDAAVLISEGSSQRVHVARVTGDFFDVVGVRASRGRVLAGADVQPSAPRVAVMSDRLWRDSFAADPAVLGQTVTIGADAFSIVGIAPRGFDSLELGSAVELWTPLVPPPDEPSARGNRGLSVVGRLASGVTISQAQARLDVLARHLAELYPASNLGTLQHPMDPRPMAVVRHARLDPDSRADVAAIGGLLLVATMCVLLIACANVASLLLARATSRRREMAVRLALGASRGRLFRQLLTESVVIGLAGGALGMLVALWATRGLPLFFPPEIARLIDFRMDVPELVFAIAISFAASLVFGLAPALQTRRWSQALATRGEGSGGDAAGGQRVRKVLVVVQVALSCVLLVSTALLARTARNITRADPGFSTRAGVVVSLELPSPRIDAAHGAEFYREAVTRLKALPGVESASLASVLPLTRSGRRGFRVDGYEPKPGEDLELNLNVVSNAYFETLGIELGDGRVFDDRDRADSTPVVVVNQMFADRYFAGHAVGRRIRDSRQTDLEIVGVVQTGAYLTIQSPRVPFVYYPLAQAYNPAMKVITRVATDPDSLVAPMRKTLAGIRSDVAVFRIISLESHLSEASAAERLSATLVTVCGLFATLLASVGVYGVMAFAVVRRSREIGVRIAVGARPSQILGLIAREGATLAIIGTALGLLGAAFGTRVLQSMALLYGVSPSDVVSFVAAPLLLGAIVMVASIVPLRRALRVDPMVVLRQD
jgi:predicted permease